MAHKTVVLSDVTGQLVPEGDEIGVIVKQHPSLEEVVILDAGESEVKALLAGESDYVLIELRKGEQSKTVVVDLVTFNGIFTTDPYQALASARRVKVTKANNGERRGNAEHLAEVRTWCKANGWPEIKDKGRVPAEAQAAFDQAHAS